MHAALGGEGVVAPMPRIEEVDDLDDPAPRRATRSSPATTARHRPWQSRPVKAGTPVAKPSPIFTKLDPSVVDDELGRLAGDVEPEPAG